MENDTGRKFPELEKTKVTLGRLYRPWLKVGLEPPTTCISELAKLANVSPFRVLDIIESGQATILSGDLLFQAEITGPLKDGELKRAQNSRFYQRSAAKIWSEGQRYQRRFQFQPVNSKGKPTRRRIEARTVESQVKKAKVSLKVADTTDQRELTKDRLVKKAEKKYRPNTLPNLLFDDGASAKVRDIFERFNRAPNQDNFDSAVENAIKSLKTNDFIQFLQFSCPRIDAQKLNTDNPEGYILDNPRGNNFETTIGRGRTFFRALNAEGFETWINIILGDTDEEDFIFPVIGGPKLNQEVIYQRRKAYQNAFNLQASQLLPRWCWESYLWSDIEANNPNGLDLTPNPKEADIEAEAKRTADFFEPDNYYGGLPLPSADQLLKISRLKFKAYGYQGYVLRRLFPNGILLQNEFPLLLRSRMINCLNLLREDEMPILYPYTRGDNPY